MGEEEKGPEPKRSEPPGRREISGQRPRWAEPDPPARSPEERARAIREYRDNRDRLRADLDRSEAMTELEEIGRGIDSRLDPLTARLQAVVDRLARLTQRNIRDRLRADIAPEENRQAAVKLQETMTRLGLWAECPKCGQPAKLRWRQSARGGFFQFEHYYRDEESGEVVSTNHLGGATFPAFRLIRRPE